MHTNTRLGVTLIELLVAMSVASLVLMAVLGIFSFSTRQLGVQTSRAEAVIQGNQAMNALCKDIGSSMSVQADSNGNPSVFTFPANTDASGNYVQAVQNGSPAYVAGFQRSYYLSNNSGSSSSGTNLWREQWQAGSTGLLGLLSTPGSWVPDTTWSQQPDGKSGKYPHVSSLTFSTTGMPANTVQITLTTAYTEGKQTSNYTISRNVYLANHN